MPHDEGGAVSAFRGDRQPWKVDGQPLAVGEAPRLQTGDLERPRAANERSCRERRRTGARELGPVAEVGGEADAGRVDLPAIREDGHAGGDRIAEEEESSGDGSADLDRRRGKRGRDADGERRDRRSDQGGGPHAHTAGSSTITGTRSYLSRVPARTRLPVEVDAGESSPGAAEEPRLRHVTFTLPTAPVAGSPPKQVDG